MKIESSKTIFPPNNKNTTSAFLDKALMREIINDAILQPFTHKISLAETFSSSVVYKWIWASIFCGKLLLNESPVFCNKATQKSQPPPNAMGDWLPNWWCLTSLMPNIKEMYVYKKFVFEIHKQGSYLCI